MSLSVFLKEGEPKKSLPQNSSTIKRKTYGYVMAWSEKGVRICDATVVSGGRRSERDVIIKGSRFMSSSGQEAIIIDARKLVVTPGLVDIQINGFGGHEFVIGQRAVSLAQKKLPKYGVTAFCPTLGCMPIDHYKPSFLKKTIDTCTQCPGAEPLGWHLEGPFINAMQRGIHRENDILDRFNEPFWRQVFATGSVAVMTLAPELGCAGRLLDTLSEYKIVAAIGHSQAMVEDVQYATTKGARFVTHLFNAMLPFHHRVPGIIGSVLGDHLLGFCVISDLCHLHREALQIAWRCHPRGLAITSDSAPFIESEEREGVFFGEKVGIYGDRVVTLPGGGLAGSMCCLDEQIRRFITATGCSFDVAVRAASEIPSSFLGLDHRKGKIAKGYDADIVFWDSTEVVATIARGELVYSRPEFLKRLKKR